MAFDDFSDGSSSISQINVTPLVDVMLVLLIIFMVAAPILQQGVELELPRETIAPIEGDEEQVVVNVDQTGKVSIGKGNQVEVKHLGERLKAILARRKDQRVFIRADRRVPYGDVMAAMGSIRRSGILKVGLITEPS
jgi:biopolymer transport protein TolR